MLAVDYPTDMQPVNTYWSIYLGGSDMIEVTINGQKIGTAKELTYTIDKEMIDDIPATLDTAIVAEQTLTLNVFYYQMMQLAQMLDKHSPKKAKRIRRLAERHNPLRLLGLL